MKFSCLGPQFCQSFQMALRRASSLFIPWKTNRLPKGKWTLYALCITPLLLPFASELLLSLYIWLTRIMRELNAKNKVSRFLRIMHNINLQINRRCLSCDSPTVSSTWIIILSVYWRQFWSAAESVGNFAGAIINVTVFFCCYYMKITPKQYRGLFIFPN